MNVTEQLKFKFSIIMAVYNAEKFLEEAIESVLQQDIGFKENVQLILVDDGSRDKSGEICKNYAKKYPNNIIVIYKENGGVASARNTGLPYASGRYLNFMDSDDKMTVNALSEVYNFFINHEDETDIVTIPIYLFDAKEGEHYLNYKFKKGNRIVDLYKEYNAVVRSASSSFFSYCCKSDIHFDERLVNGEDTKVVLSILYKKMKIGVVSSCKYMYRKHPQGGSSLLNFAKTEYGYYFGYFKYLADWAKEFYKEKLGFVPACVQYEIMVELAWRTKSKYEYSPLTIADMEEYKKILFEHYKDIDDEYILKQRVIYKEYKNFILSKKYECNPQVTPCGNDALVHFGNSIIGYISDCYVRLESMEYKDNILYLEGVTKVFGINDEEEIDAYVLCNGNKIPCQMTDRENISEMCLNEVVLRGIGFRCQIPMDNMPGQGGIKFGVTFRGLDIIKKVLKFGSFFPIDANYYHANGLIITNKNRAILWKKCTKQDGDPQEISLTNPKVSVIIPVHNAEEYLKECLDSVLKQTFREIEIICVDDGSTDSSADILAEYTKKDDRIIVIRQQNQYAGVARNSGMHIAKGEYLLFLDADDFFAPTLVETTYRQAKDLGNVDIVLFGAQKYNNITGRYIAAPNLLNRHLLPKQEVFSRMDLPDEFLLITTPSPWTKLFRKEFILKENLEFQTFSNSNDVFFVFTALSLAETITWVDKDLVYYRIAQTENTQSSKDVNPTLFLEAFEAVYNKLQRKGIYEDVEKSFKEAVINNCVYNLNTVKTDKSRIKICEKLNDPVFSHMGILNNLINYYVNNAKKLRINFKNTNKKLRDSLQRENSLKQSVSFRVGRAITWGPRKVRGGVRCYKQHGAAYTAKRLAWHVMHSK